ncbi:MAG: hypothetical protein WC383_17800 [Gammaproteobacteria bacterium]
MTDLDDTKPDPAAIPTLEEVVIPGELFADDPDAVAATESEPTRTAEAGGSEMERLVDELVERVVRETIDGMLPILKKNIQAQLEAMLPALIAARGGRSPSPPSQDQ